MTLLKNCGKNKLKVYGDTPQKTMNTPATRSVSAGSVWTASRKSETIVLSSVVVLLLCERTLGLGGPRTDLLETVAVVCFKTPGLPRGLVGDEIVVNALDVAHVDKNAKRNETMLEMFIVCL